MKESRERIAKARKRALAMVEKTLKASMEALLQMSVQEWRNVANDTARKRWRKEQVIAQTMSRIEKQDKEFLKQLVVAWGEVKKKLVQRRKRMEQVAQSLLTSEACMKLHFLSAWGGCTKQWRQERFLEEQFRLQREQVERARQQKMQAIFRSLGLAATQLLDSSWKAWNGLVEKIREAKRKQEAGMSRAMRMIFAQGQALVGLMYNLWLDELRRGRIERMKEQRERVAASRKRAIMMLDRNLKGSLETLKMVITQAWQDEVKAGKKFRKEKEDVMERVLRATARAEKMWIPVFFGYWEQIARRRSRSCKLGQKLVGELQNRLFLKFCWTFWAVRSFT